MFSLFCPFGTILPLCNFGEVVVFLRIVLFLFRNQALDKQILYAFTRREGSLHDIGAFSDFYFISEAPVQVLSEVQQKTALGALPAVL